AVFHFLTTFSPDVIAITPDANAYLDFVLAIFFAFGGSFELPVAMVILVLLGWVTPQQ
ncbi:twin-arginine translocase subunit TatC, partial [Stenotrophomonas maltophilia]